MGSRSQSANLKSKQSKRAPAIPESELDSARWRAILDAVPWGISVHSLDGKIVQANTRAADICGLSVETMSGASCQDLFHSGSSLCPHETAISTGQCSKVAWRNERGDNLSAMVSPMISDVGEVTGFVRVMSELPDTEQTGEETVGVSALATLGQMMSVIAHDVGTPLNIILGYTEYLLLRLKPGAAGHKELSTIQDQTLRIASSIRQVLDLGRPSQQRMDAIGLKGFLDESIAHMAHPLRRAQVIASVTCRTNSPLIYGDAPRLRQAFINLFVGASERVGPGGQLEIVVEEPEDDPGHVVVSIVGTEADGRGHNFAVSFAAFLNTTQTVTAAGTGLFLAREILGGFGARLDVRDTDNLGTSLAVLLPRAMYNETPGCP